VGIGGKQRHQPAFQRILVAVFDLRGCCGCVTAAVTVFKNHDIALIETDPDVDIGMYAAHIWPGLLEKGYEPKVVVEKDADRAFWPFYL